jgi:hypothetical protein
LGQFLLAVFLTALFFQLRITESQAHREDFEAITALASLAESPAHQVLADSQKQDDGFDVKFGTAVQSSVSAWFRENQPEADAAHRRCRVAGWLTKGGMGADEVGSLSGKGRGDKIPFLFFRMSVTPLQSAFGDEAGLSKNPPVGFMLDEVRQLGAPVTLTVVQAIKPPGLPEMDFKVSQDPFGTTSPGRQSYRLQSVAVDEHAALVVEFVENTGNTQRMPKRIRYPVPVTTRPVAGFPLLEVLSTSLHAHPLTRLATDGVHYDHLYRTYGGVRLDNARTMTASRMLDSFQDVNILGFSFSPKYFWIFVFATLAAALVAVAVHLKGGVHDDEPTTFGLHALMNRPTFRALFWCGLPAVTMLLARPQGDPPIWIVIVYWVGLAGLVALGAWLVGLSVRVTRKGAVAAASKQ